MINNLTLDIAKSNTVQKTSLVSTKELASILDVHRDTVNYTVERLNNDGLLRQSEIARNARGGYLFTEEQATLIKQEIQKHHNLASRKIDSVSTEYEENMLIENAMMILKQRELRLQEKIIELENENKELVPKAEVYERISESTGLKTIGETAKILGIGEKRLFALLRENGIFFYDNGVNQVKQQYINSGYFQTKENPYVQNGVNKLYTRIFVTSKGLLWLENKISA